MSGRMCGLNASGKRGNPLSLLLNIALAMCTAFALTIDLNVRSGNNYVNWAASVPESPAVPLLFAVVLYVLLKTRKTLPALGVVSWILSLFLGFWWVLVKSIANTGEINQPFLSSGQMLKTAVMTVGMAVIYHLFFRILVYALTEGNEWKLCFADRNRLVCRIADFYKRHTVLLCMGAILLVWLPHFIVAYPCAMNGDSTAQLREWTGMYPFSSHHPPFGTFLIGMAYQAGLLLGEASTGLAVYVAVQMILGAWVLGYLQDVMRRLGASWWLRTLTLFASCFCPVYCDNITTIIKDVPYTYGMVLMLCEIAVCVFLHERLTLAGMLRMMIGGIFVMLMRNNGKFILIPLTVCMAAWAVKKPKVRASVACALAAALVLSMGVDAWLMHAYDIVPGSRREALSLPFQQTARFVREHEAELPQDEYDAIERVIGMSGLAKAYDPVISDPVKARFREGVTSEALKQYFEVWLRQFARDPMCYVEATLIQNILLLDPQTKNLAIFSGTGFDEETKAVLRIMEPDVFRGVQAMEEYLRDMLLTVPGMAQLNSLGFHCCVLLFVCLWSMKKRKKNMILMLLPMVISVLVIIAGPCIQNQDRYGFPIVYCMPLILACLSYELRNANKEEVNV